MSRHVALYHNDVSRAEMREDNRQTRRNDKGDESMCESASILRNTFVHDWFPSCIFAVSFT